MKKFLVLTVAVLATMISFNLLAECTGLSFDPAMDYLQSSQGYAPNKLVSLELTGIPSEYVGQLTMEFYPNDFDTESWTDFAAVGTYDLGTGNNVSFATCNQCVQLALFDATSYDFVSQFYQQSGTIQVTRTDFADESYPYYEGILTVKLAEANVDEDTFETTFVENGDCYEVESAAWSNFPADGDTGDTEVPGDTGDTEVPGDTGDTEAPGDTGDTEVPGDTGDTEVPGDTGDTEVPGDTGSEPADTGDTEVPGDTGSEPTTEPTDSEQTPAEDDEDSGGCALVTL